MKKGKEGKKRKDGERGQREGKGKKQKGREEKESKLEKRTGQSITACTGRRGGERYPRAPHHTGVAAGLGARCPPPAPLGHAEVRLQPCSCRGAGSPPAVTERPLPVRPRCRRVPPGDSAPRPPGHRCPQ